MATSRHLVLVALVLLVCQSVSHAEDEQAARGSNPCEKWIARITADLSKTDKEDRASAVTYAAGAVATAGEDDRAMEMVRQVLPPEERKSALLGIADAQSRADRLKEALATVAECPTEAGRQFALSIVAIRQAQRGDVEDAISLLPKLDKGCYLDNVLATIAEAQANAGEQDAARDTAKRIADDEQQRMALEQVSDAPQEDPLSKLHSIYLRQQLGAMLLFSGSSSQRDAILAIAAAQEKDRSTLTRHMNAALAKAEAAKPLQRATIQTLLAVALVEAGDPEKAKEMILRSRKAGSDEWLGVSSIFGSPVLVSLLIRLDMDKELQKLMDGLRESDGMAGPIAYHANLWAAGATYAELNRLDSADDYYAHLNSPLARVHFAAGVLSYLQQGAE